MRLRLKLQITIMTARATDRWQDTTIRKFRGVVDRVENPRPDKIHVFRVAVMRVEPQRYPRGHIRSRRWHFWPTWCTTFRMETPTASMDPRITLNPKGGYRFLPRSVLTPTVAMLVAILWCASVEAGEVPQALEIAHEPQFFVDDYVVDNRWGVEYLKETVTRVFHPPKKNKHNPLIAGTGGYVNVVRDEQAGLFRMWYQDCTRVRAVVLEFTPDTGDGITLTADPDFFAISEITLRSTNRSNGWAIRADQGTQRSLRVESVNTNGFHNGVLITNALNVTIENCRIGHTFPNNPTGIGIQIGDVQKMGGNGVTISDCYLNSLEKGIVTYAQACLISRPCLELCRIGIETTARRPC